MERRDMKLQDFSHEHALVFIDKQSNESEKVYCSGCGELVSGSCFGCLECGFYLDKMCAEAPSEINHPFHRDHSLKLLVSPPHPWSRVICDFCEKRCDKFVYNCSCYLDFHIKCALLSNSIAEKKDDIPHKDALISIENRFESEELKEAMCLQCRKPLLDFPYLDLGYGICLHKKCVDLPTEINHFSHNQHPLILQFNSKRLPCQICQETQYRGFVYSCLPCNIVLHIACAELPFKINHLCHRKHPLILQLNPDSLPCQICQEPQYEGLVYCCSICKLALHVYCASPPPTIKGEIHEHPFSLFWKQVSFICDACGTTGNYASYICSKCSLTVHEKCISLPLIIKISRHHHKIFHTFNLGQHEITTWNCKFCPEEVNAQHGSYCCSDCNYVVHANCLREYYHILTSDELENTDEQFNENSAFVVIKETKLGENIAIPSEIKHLSHQHNLVLSNDFKGGDKFCDGCMLSISTLFYHCSQCDFFLHKLCAESPKKKYLWFEANSGPFAFTFDPIFSCQRCYYQFNTGFAYKSTFYAEYICLGCALISDTATIQGHEHCLSFYYNYKGQCGGCGNELSGAYACKDCKFAVDFSCLRLPTKIVHKCDEHPLILTCHEDTVYSEYNYCDICEQSRNPHHWFYHCVSCDTSAHPNCVVKSYSFMKLGGSYKMKNHPHPVTFTQKICKCYICDQPCLDLALECLENGCNFIVHWECIKNSLDWPNLLLKWPEDEESS